jgi:hypothetical protein
MLLTEAGSGRGNRDFKQGATRISIREPLGAPFKIHVIDTISLM